MASAHLDDSTREPRWVRGWLALLPIAYVFSPLAVLALPHLRRFPRSVLWVLGAYALSQQLPALVTPEPLLASVLAALRTVLLAGLLAVGAALGSTRAVQAMAFGLVVVYATSLLSSVAGGAGGLQFRLGHPYMTPIAVGLAGALGAWIAVFGRGARWWRVPLGAAGLGIALLSGSRGPLAALLVGTVLGVAVSSARPRMVAVMAGAGMLAAAAVLVGADHVPALARLSSADTSGRDVIWADTLSVIHAHPVGGVGAYRLGVDLRPPGERCELWTSGDAPPAPCPAALDALGDPWLIAHNLTLQQLAETGPLGLLGLLLLLGVIVRAAVATRDGLSVAVIGGMLVATVNDNTVLVPSPFFAEAFWVLSGAALARAGRVDGRAGLTAAALGAVLSVPLLGMLGSAPPSRTALTLLSAPTVAPDGGPYRMAAQFAVPPGTYRAVLRTCAETCVRVQVLPFTATAAGAPVLVFRATVRALTIQRLQLQLYPGAAGYRPRPLAQTEWTLRSEP